MIVIYKKEGMYVMTRKIVLDIKALRKEKNMTVSDLANRLNKSVFEIKVWEAVRGLTVKQIQLLLGIIDEISDEEH